MGFCRRWVDAGLGYAGPREVELVVLADDNVVAAAIHGVAWADDNAAWLFGIARNVLGRSAERRRVESRARRRLGMPRLVLEDDTLAALERIHAGQLMEGALAYLPADP